MYQPCMKTKNKNVGETVVRANTHTHKYCQARGRFNIIAENLFSKVAIDIETGPRTIANQSLSYYIV